MTTEKKLIACSLLVIVIGVCSILPLGVLMATPTKAEASSEEPWYEVDVTYSYWEAKNGTFEDYEYPDYVNTNETEVESVGYLALLNFTLTADIENVDADARIEYFVIELSSETGVITNDFTFIGTNISPSFRIGDFHFGRDGWFDTSNMSGSGLLKYNWTNGDSILWTASSGSTGTIMEDSEVSKIRKAEELFITVYRLGWVSFSENSTLVTLTDKIIVNQIQLQKYGEGWLFNNIIPEEELPTTDLWKPINFGYITS